MNAKNNMRDTLPPSANAKEILNSEESKCTTLRPSELQKRNLWREYEESMVDESYTEEIDIAIDSLRAPDNVEDIDVDLVW